jgi:predicted HNH restriction endonuclease
MPVQTNRTTSQPGRKRDENTKLITVAGRQRDPAVVAYARVRSGNTCEIASCTMPLFQTFLGVDFVEVHHIKPLSVGGTDTIENVACVCPSHHREAHLGRNAGSIETELRQVRTKSNSS